MKRDLVYTTDDWRSRPFDATRIYAPATDENRRSTAPVGHGKPCATYKGRELPRAPRTDPYVHLYAYGSYLGCLTAKRWLGQG